MLLVPGEDKIDDWRALFHAAAVRYGLSASDLERDGWLHIVPPNRWRLADEGEVRRDDEVDRLGSLLADVLGLDANSRRDRRRLVYLIDQWIGSCLLAKVERYVDGKKLVPFIEVGGMVEL